MSNKEIVYFALFAAVALILYIFETIIPKPLPWLRLGLANVVTLIVLINLGWKAATGVTLTRIIVGSILVGTFFTPAFLMALCGGLIACGVMVLGVRYFYPPFSVIGISIIGAVAHNFTQLVVASVIFVRSWELLYLLPVFCLISLLMGTFTGLVTYSFQQRFGSIISIEKTRSFQ